MTEHASDGSVNLGHAAQAVGVLHAGVVGEVRVADFAVIKNLGEMGCGGDLTCMRAGLMDAGIEGDWRALESFERHSSGEVGELGKTAGVDYGERAYCGHGLGAVEQGQAFFGSERQWRQACGGEGLCCGLALALINRFAFADYDQCQMSEWG